MTTSSHHQDEGNTLDSCQWLLTTLDVEAAPQIVRKEGTG